MSEYIKQRTYDLHGAKRASNARHPSRRRDRGFASIGDVGATARRATPTVSASTRAPIDANRARAPSSRARGDDATGYAKARARERLSTTDDGRRERRATDGARTDETRTR